MFTASCIIRSWSFQCSLILVLIFSITCKQTFAEESLNKSNTEKTFHKTEHIPSFTLVPENRNLLILRRTIAYQHINTNNLKNNLEDESKYRRGNRKKEAKNFTVKRKRSSDFSEWYIPVANNLLQELRKIRHGKNDTAENSEAFYTNTFPSVTRLTPLTTSEWRIENETAVVLKNEEKPSRNPLQEPGSVKSEPEKAFSNATEVSTDDAKAETKVFHGNISKRYQESRSGMHKMHPNIDSSLISPGAFYQKYFPMQVIPKQDSSSYMHRMHSTVDYAKPVLTGNAKTEIKKFPKRYRESGSGTHKMYSNIDSSLIPPGASHMKYFLIRMKPKQEISSNVHHRMQSNVDSSLVSPNTERHFKSENAQAPYIARNNYDYARVISTNARNRGSYGSFSKKYHGSSTGMHKMHSNIGPSLVYQVSKQHFILDPSFSGNKHHAYGKAFSSGDAITHNDGFRSSFLQNHQGSSARFHKMHPNINSPMMSTDVLYKNYFPPQMKSEKVGPLPSKSKDSMTLLFGKHVSGIGEVQNKYKNPESYFRNPSINKNYVLPSGKNLKDLLMIEQISHPLAHVPLIEKGTSSKKPSIPGSNLKSKITQSEKKTVTIVKWGGKKSGALKYPEYPFNGHHMHQGQRYRNQMMESAHRNAVNQNYKNIKFSLGRKKAHYFNNNNNNNRLFQDRINGFAHGQTIESQNGHFVYGIENPEVNEMYFKHANIPGNYKLLNRGYNVSEAQNDSTAVIETIISKDINIVNNINSTASEANGTLHKTYKKDFIRVQISGGHSDHDAVEEEKTISVLEENFKTEVISIPLMCLIGLTVLVLSCSIVFFGFPLDIRCFYCGRSDDSLNHISCAKFKKCQAQNAKPCRNDVLNDKYLNRKSYSQSDNSKKTISTSDSSQNIGRSSSSLENNTQGKTYEKSRPSPSKKKAPSNLIETSRGHAKDSIPKKGEEKTLVSTSEGRSRNDIGSPWSWTLQKVKAANILKENERETKQSFQKVGSFGNQRNANEVECLPSDRSAACFSPKCNYYHRLGNLYEYDLDQVNETVHRRSERNKMVKVHRVAPKDERIDQVSFKNGNKSVVGSPWINIKARSVTVYGDKDNTDRNDNFQSEKKVQQIDYKSTDANSRQTAKATLPPYHSIIEMHRYCNNDRTDAFKDPHRMVQVDMYTHDNVFQDGAGLQRSKPIYKSTTNLQSAKKAPCYLHHLVNETFEDCNNNIDFSFTRPANNRFVPLENSHMIQKVNPNISVHRLFLDNPEEICESSGQSFYRSTTSSHRTSTSES